MFYPFPTHHPLILAFCLVALIPLPASAAAGVEPGEVTITLTPVFDAGETVLDLITGPDEALYLCTLSGRILRLADDGEASLVLDLAGADVPFHDGPGHGLWGFAFHPGFSDPGSPGYGRCYTYANERKFESNGATLTGLPDNAHPEFYTPGTPTPTVDNYRKAAFSHFNVVREWRVQDTEEPLTLDPDSSRVLLRIAHSNDPGHNGGGPRFGPDDLLYLAIGDGGGSGNDFRGNVNNPDDGHTDGIGNGQDLSSALGKVLRIDPIPTNQEGTLSANAHYRIPADNPFADGPSGNFDAIFAYGFRNPWRFAFDDHPDSNGSLYLSDVGQHHREEINVVTRGGNYGWPYLEGSIPLIAQNNYSGEDLSPPVAVLRTPPEGYENFVSVLPLAEYKTRRQYAPDGAASVLANLTGEGTAIVGGPVYRGAGSPALYGHLFLGDYSTAGDPPGDHPPNTGRLFYIDPAADDPLIREFQLADGANIPSVLMGYGEGPSSEVYAFFGNGAVLRVEPRTETFTAWIERLDLPPQARGAEDDPDGDGLDNLLEFVLLRDPMVVDPSPLEVTAVQSNGVHYPAITFRHRNETYGVALAIEIETALAFDEPLTAPIEEASTDHGDGTRTVTIRSGVSTEQAPRQFLRLRATLMP